MTISGNTSMLLVGVLVGAAAFGAVAVAASTGGPFAMADGLGMGAGMGGMMGASMDGSMDAMMGSSHDAMMGGSHDAMMAGGTCPYHGDAPMDPAQCAELMAAGGGCPMM